MHSSRNDITSCCQGARCPASGGRARRRACAAATGATRACPGAWAGQPSSPSSPPSCSDRYYNLEGEGEEQKNNKVEPKNTRNCYIKELECLQSQCCTVQPFIQCRHSFTLSKFKIVAQLIRPLFTHMIFTCYFHDIEKCTFHDTSIIDRELMILSIVINVTFLHRSDLFAFYSHIVLYNLTVKMFHRCCRGQW